MWISQSPDKKGKIINIHINIPLCIYHTVHQILYVTYQKPEKNLSNGVYSLKCSTLDRIYVGQTGRNLKISCLEFWTININSVLYKPPCS